MTAHENTPAAIQLSADAARETEMGLAALAASFGSRFTSGLAQRQNHGATEGFYPRQYPEAVVFIDSTEAASEALRICHRHRIPVIPYGAGSSLEGQLVATKGGVSLDMSLMNRIIGVAAADMDILVEAGVTRSALNAELRHHGLFFPVDPGADATLGGMASTRATGTTTVRYGGMRQHILGLKVVLPTGEIVSTGGRARKSSAGYDLTSLFVGAEGTLGLVTELRLRVHGIPEEIASVICSFVTLNAAVDAVIQSLQSGVDVARIELLDAVQMRAVNIDSKTSYPEQATLFLEFHGSPGGVAEQIEKFRLVADDCGGQDLNYAVKVEDRNRLWLARHRAYFAARALAPGKQAITTDICVPISRLAECILVTRDEIDRAGILGTIVGHVGDGNFHTVLMFDEGNAEEIERVKEIASQMAYRAIDMGGTCTGEHGIGLGKKKYLEKEAGPSLAVMRSIKISLDPHQIMNPGKIFDM